MKGMGDILRQAQLMQGKIAKLQQEMAERTVDASSGGGMVSVQINGKQEITSLKIDPTVLEGGDVEMLQDLVVAAVNEGVRLSKAALEREMAAITGGIHLPGVV